MEFAEYAVAGMYGIAVLARFVWFNSAASRQYQY
jgi:hypothetical protein